MTKIKIKKNRHPHSNLWFRIKNFMANNNSEFKFTLTKSCWSGWINKDSGDANKIHGIRGWLSFKNGNEAWIGFIPKRYEKYRFDIIFGVRHKGKLWTSDVIETVRYGQECTSYVKATTIQTKDSILNKPIPDWNRGYAFELNGQHYFVYHKSADGQRMIQPYHGGDNKALHDMFMELEKI